MWYQDIGLKKMKQKKTQLLKFVAVSVSSENKELKEVIKELESKYQVTFDLNKYEDDEDQMEI